MFENMRTVLLKVRIQHLGQRMAVVEGPESLGDRGRSV